MMDSDKPTAAVRVFERVLDILPILTTLLLLSIYPLLRYLPDDPFWAEVLRFAIITLWIGYLIIDADMILHPQDLAFREHCHRQEAERAKANGDRGVVLQALTTYTEITRK